MAVVAETRISHSVARVSAAPAVVSRSLLRQVRDTLVHLVLMVVQDAFHLELDKHCEICRRTFEVSSRYGHMQLEVGAFGWNPQVTDRMG